MDMKPSTHQVSASHNDMRKDNYAAVMLDYATGALSPAMRRLVSLHATMKPEARHMINEIEALGGALLGFDKTMRHESIKNLHGSGESQVKIKATDRAAEMPEINFAVSGQISRLAWRTVGPGYRYARLADGDGIYALHLKAGRTIPDHIHNGLELTLLIHGSFEDERGLYQAGDLAVAEEGFEHAPKVTPDGDCLCLVANERQNYFKSTFVRVFTRGFGMEV